MPMSGSNYVAPTWVNNAPPALDATELQAICNTIQENQGDVTSLQSKVASLSSLVNGKAQAQVVSYVGTGTYGASNPCSITASFPIDVAIALGYQDYYNIYGNMDIHTPVMVSSTLTTSYVGNRGFTENSSSLAAYGKKSYDGKTFSWYGTSNGSQLNSSGFTYYFLCIG